MSNIFFSSTLMWSATPKQIMQTAYNYGACGVELWAQQLDIMDYDPSEFAHLANEYQLELLIHAKSWDLNFASLNEKIRQASLDELKLSLLLAKQVGATEITVHPPRITLQNLRESSIKKGRCELEKLLDFADQLSISISLEIMEKIPKELVTTVDEYFCFVGELFPRLYTTLDIAHCDGEQEFWYYYDRLPCISKLHISNRKGKKYHTPLAEGEYCFERMLPQLQKLGLPLVIEGFDDSDQFETIRSNMSLIKLQEEKNVG